MAGGVNQKWWYSQLMSGNRVWSNKVASCLSQNWGMVIVTNDAGWVGKMACVLSHYIRVGKTGASTAGWPPKKISSFWFRLNRCPTVVMQVYREGILARLVPKTSSL